MLVYRIALNQYAQCLHASGLAARWNPNHVMMIYTSANRSLSCLENVVHRGKTGLMQLFSLMTIEIAESILIRKINLEELVEEWKSYQQMNFTQKIGETWVQENFSAILEVPSAIVEGEKNYLINPKHPDFKFVKLIKAEPFVFDQRIKL